MAHLVKRIYRFVYRSSVDGKFVSYHYWLRHPSTTQRNRVKIGYCK